MKNLARLGRFIKYRVLKGCSRVKSVNYWATNDVVAEGIITKISLSAVNVIYLLCGPAIINIVIIYITGGKHYGLSD